MRIVGTAVPPNHWTSSPTASIELSISGSEPETLTSVTASASSPLRIQSPAAPREKSPVTRLTPAPIRLVR